MEIQQRQEKSGEFTKTVHSSPCNTSQVHVDSRTCLFPEQHHTTNQNCMAWKSDQDRFTASQLSDVKVSTRLAEGG